MTHCFIVCKSDLCKATGIYDNTVMKEENANMACYNHGSDNLGLSSDICLA